jgi:hypothetical protein
MTTIQQAARVVSADGTLDDHEVRLTLRDATEQLDAVVWVTNAQAAGIPIGSKLTLTIVVQP